VDIVAYGTFVLADHLTETQSDAKYVQQTHTGNVSIDGTFGIGTSSPSGLFHIVDGRDELSFTNGSNNVYLSLTAGFNTKNSVLNFYNTSDAGYGRIDYDHATEYMAFSTNSSEAMRITSSGSVGIGTDSPTSKLEVNVDGTSAITVRSSDGGQANLIFGDQADADRGRIVYSNADESMRFAVNNLVEAARIDSSGNLGLGTQTPQNYSGQTSLTINGSTTGRLDLQGNGVQGGTIFSTNGTGLTVQTGYGKILTLESGTTGNIQFKTNGSEKMQLTQYGNLLVGTTDSTPVGSGSNGTAIGNGIIESLKYKGASLKLDRYGDSNNSNDGSIIEFYSGSSGQVGSIGLTSTQRLTIGSSVDTDVGLVFQPDTDKRIYPVGDDVVELGRTGHRFKDLMLSGGVYLGGTGSANKLDDYEEGDWTPVVRFGTSSTGITYGDQVGRYTKVGRKVTVEGGFNLTSRGSATGTFNISGLPFTQTDAGGYSDSSVCFGLVAATNLPSQQIAGLIARGTTEIYPREVVSGTSTLIPHTDLNSNSAFIFTVTYFTTA
jgi:hypothetical protein